jgi:hypothetical protein
MAVTEKALGISDGDALRRAGPEGSWPAKK